MSRRFSYVIGIDDAPFEPSYRGDVMVIGAVYNGPRLEGIVRGKVRRDGANATRNLARMIEESRFAPSLRAVLLQGVTLAGFNVVDIEALSQRLKLAVVAVCRKRPNLAKIERALRENVPGGARKWALIRRLGPARRSGDVYLHHAGIQRDDAVALVERFAVHSRLPEPVRTAHLVAGALQTGESRHRA